MNNTRTYERIVKAFGMTNMLILSDLDRIEQQYGIEIGHRPKATDRDQAYYPQFDQSLRKEAADMASQYEIFYCLERSIRALVADVLESAEEDEWWVSERVPPQIKTEVKNRMKKEQESGITPRSSDPIDFTTFGELGELIKANWDIFGSVFNNQKAVEKIMFNLNSLRNPIAHCSRLAEDEVLRLGLSLKDWFRIMI